MMSSNSSASSASGSSLAELVTKAKGVLGDEVDHTALKCLLSTSQILRNCVMNHPEDLPRMMDNDVVVLTGDDLNTIKHLSKYIEERLEFNSKDCANDYFTLTPEDKRSFEEDDENAIKNVFAFLKHYSNGELVGEYIGSEENDNYRSTFTTRIFEYSD